MITVSNLNGKKESTASNSDGPLPTLMTDTISTSTITRIKFPIKQKKNIGGKLTKNEQLLEKSNFHLLRAYQEKKRIEDEKKAVE